MSDSGTKRKTYGKPEVKRFALRAQEAVLGFCKSASAGLPTTGGVGCNNVTCKTRGS
jgi:hypothetical protein